MDIPSTSEDRVALLEHFHELARPWLGHADLLGDVGDLHAFWMLGESREDLSLPLVCAKAAPPDLGRCRRWHHSLLDSLYFSKLGVDVRELRHQLATAVAKRVVAAREDLTRFIDSVCCAFGRRQRCLRS